MPTSFDGGGGLARPGSGYSGAADDLVAWVRPGYRFSDPSGVLELDSGQPRAPGHLLIPDFVGGGAGVVRTRTVSDTPARTVDVAPTVAAPYGLGRPKDGWDGTARADAFTGLPVR